MNTKVFHFSVSVFSVGFLLTLLCLFSVYGCITFAQDGKSENSYESVNNSESKTGIVVIDPGHGGTTNLPGSSYNNAKGKNGTLEKDIALKISIKAAEKVNKMNHKVSLTRNADINVSSKNRCKLADTNRADVFVSVHLNGDNDTNIQGTETWVSDPQNDNSILLASSIQGRVVAVTKHNDRGLKSVKKDRPQKVDVLKMENHSLKTSVCLLEVSYLTKPSEEQRLKNNVYLDSIATAIAQGINDYISGSTIKKYDVEESDFPE